MLRTWHAANRDSVLSLVELFVQMLHDDTIYFALKPGVVSGAIAAQTHSALSRSEAASLIEAITTDRSATTSGASQDVQSALMRMIRRYGTVAREVQRLATPHGSGAGGKRAVRSLALRRDPLRTTAVRLLRTLAMLRNADFERELERAGVPSQLVMNTADVGARGSDLPVVEQNRHAWTKWASALQKKTVAIRALGEEERQRKREADGGEFAEDGVYDNTEGGVYDDEVDEWGEPLAAGDATLFGASASFRPQRSAARAVAPTRRRREQRERERAAAVAKTKTARAAQGGGRGRKTKKGRHRSKRADLDGADDLDRERDDQLSANAGGSREAQQLENVFDILGDRIVRVKRVYDDSAKEMGAGGRLDRDATTEALVALGAARVQAELLIPTEAAEVDFFAFCSFASQLLRR